MNPKLAVHQVFLIVSIGILVACGTRPTERVPGAPATNIPTSIIIPEMAAVLPTFTPYPPYVYTVASGDTCVSIATAFNITVEELISRNNLPLACPVEAGQQLIIPYSHTSPVMPSPTSLATPTPLSEFPLHGYVVAFVKDGDLYFQDGENLPVKLSHVGENTSRPEISPDNQKTLFYRSDGNEDIPYSIDSDGTNERAVMPRDWLDSLEPGTEKNVFGFIPHTHQLLLLTYLCEPQAPESPCRVRLFVADTDTGEINGLADFDLPYYDPSYDRNIEVSPNGEMIAVGTIDGTDILTLDGKVIRESILPYKPSTGVLYPSLFWLPDSSGLVILLPDKIYDSVAYDNVVAYTVWRYFIEDNVIVEMPIDIPPMASEIEISPDRKWGVYGGFGDAERSLYLADLTTGIVQIFGEDGQPSFSWGPDSRHFVYGTALQKMSTVEDPFSAITICGYGKWVDASHFICIIDEMNGPTLRMAEINGGRIEIYDLGLDENVERGSILIKLK
jgi:hypothetical protein